MQIKIHKMDMFHTPKTQDDLLDFIERLPDGEKIAALTAMGMTWNFLAEQVNNTQESEDADDLSE